MLFLFIFTVIYKSPLGPPFLPGSPSPLNTTVWLSSIPAGIFTFILGCFLTVPFPLQFSQGSFIISPVPWHALQGLVVCICPNIVLWTCVTWPVPWHVGHLIGDVPGLAPFPWHTEHSSSLVITISFSTPINACSNVKSSLTFKSAPFVGPCFLDDEVLPPNPPPNIEENISPKSPKSPKLSKPEPL